MMTTRKLEDPKNRYPNPPFKEQQQRWPGLAKKMEPRPDHGEKSYKGSGRLTGRKALITGGDSGMGRGAAIAFAREGADVAINYFSTEEPDAEEVIALINKPEAKRSRFPEICEKKTFARNSSKRRSSNSVGWTFLFAMRGVSRHGNQFLISQQRISTRR